MRLPRTLLLCIFLYLAVLVALSTCKHSKHDKDKHTKHKIYGAPSAPTQQPAKQQVPLTDTFATHATMKANGPEVTYSDVGTAMEALTLTERAMAEEAQPKKDTVAEQPTPLRHSASSSIKHAVKDVKEAAKHMAAKVKDAIHPTATEHKEGGAQETPLATQATTPLHAEFVLPSPSQTAAASNTSSTGIKHAVQSVGSGLKHTAEQVAAGLKHAAENAGGAVKNAAETVKDEISEAGHRVVGTGSDTGMGEAVKDTGVPADKAQPVGEPVLLQNTVLTGATHRRETIARTHTVKSDLNRENPEKAGAEASTEQTHRSRAAK